MYQFIKIFLAGSLFIHTAINSADGKSIGEKLSLFLVLNNDTFYAVMSHLDYPDKVSLSMVSTQMRTLGSSRIFTSLGNFKIDGHNSADLPEFFRRLKNLKSPDWKFNAPLSIAVSSEDELKTISDTIYSQPCISTPNLSLMSVPENISTCRLSIGLDNILNRQPNLKIIKLHGPARAYDEMPTKIATILGNLPSLTSCSIWNMPMKPKAVQQLAKNTSLTSLSINRLEGDGDVMLPKNLTILKIDGFEIKEQVFSCLKTLSQLSSVSINSYWNQNTATLDVSPWLKDIIDRVMRLEINGIYSVDRNAIISIAKANNQCTNVYINKDPSGQERIRLDIKKEGHASFLFDLPFDELDAAIDIVHTKLKQGKGINLSIQENSLVINENILPGLSISLGKLVEKKIILNEILSKLPNDVELSLNLYDADRMLINHEFLQTFFNKHWHALDIFGTFDIDDAAFLHLNMNASLIDFSLNWESDHGYGNTRSHLGIRNMKNSKDRKHSSARFLSHTKDKIISGKMVIDIASAIPNLEITVSGENRFSSEDIIVLANNYGFHRIELDLRDVKTLGKALGYFRQIFISAQNKNPYIFLENYTADAKPRVALGANAATPDTIAALCMMPHLEALHLGETMLTTPMFQALKKCSALHTLTVRTIDSGVINFSDLPNLKILEVADWNAHIEKALSNVFGMQEIRFQATGDSSGFIPWARAKHAAATSLLSMMGNPKDGFIIKGLAVGKIPQELIRVLDQDLEARASANDRGGQDSDMPKQEYSLAFIDTDITDDVLSKLQYFPGLISLDLRGSSRISISGITSIMNNKTLRELLLPKSFQNQADLLKIENSNLAVSFVD